MRSIRNSYIIRLTVVALFLLGILPGQPILAAQGSDTTVVNEEHNLTITWDETWRANIPPDANNTIISLDRDNTVFVNIAIMDSSIMTPEEAIWMLFQENDELIEDNSSADPATIVFGIEDVGIHYYAQSYTVNDGDTTLFIAMGTVPIMQQTGFEIVEAELAINGEPLFRDSAGDPEDLTGISTPETGTPISGSGETPEATPEATESTSRSGRTTRGTTETPEATEESLRTTRGSSETPEVTETVEATEQATRTSRTTRGTAETPEPTEVVEPTAEATDEPGGITRTPRNGSGTTETPEATEVPTDPSESGSFTGPVYGYTIEYDPNLWQEADRLESASIDGIRLDSETGTAFFIGTDEYGVDPVGCLVGEDARYSAGAERISSWDVATGADGEPLWYESDELAWGVFAYTFTTSSGEEVEFVDYISCETIPGQDAVLIVQLTSLPDEYNTNLDLVLDILETIQFQP